MPHILAYVKPEEPEQLKYRFMFIAGNTQYAYYGSDDNPDGQMMLTILPQTGKIVDYNTDEEKGEIGVTIFEEPTRLGWISMVNVSIIVRNFKTNEIVLQDENTSYYPYDLSSLPALPESNYYTIEVNSL